MGFSERAWTVYRLKRGLGKKVGVVVVLRGVGVDTPYCTLWMRSLQEKIFLIGKVLIKLDFLLVAYT